MRLSDLLPRLKQNNEGYQYWVSLIWQMILLRLLFIGKGGEGIEDDGEDAEGCVVCPQLGNGGSLQIYRAQNLYIVSWRQYEREALRPHWH